MNKQSVEIVSFDKQRTTDISLLPKLPFSMYICGAKGGGKSSLVLNLLTNPLLLNKKFNKIVFVSPTANLDKKIKDVIENNKITVKNTDLIRLLKKIGKKNILEDGIMDKIKGMERDDGSMNVEFYETLTPDLINEFISDNKKITEEFGKKYADKILLIIDDSIESKIFTKEVFKKLLFKSRHYSISMIITSQSYFLLPKALRLNMSYLVLFETANKKELENIYNENASSMSNKQFFKLVQDIFSTAFNFLLINYQNPKAGRFQEQFKKFIDVAEYSV